MKKMNCKLLLILQLVLFFNAVAPAQEPIKLIVRADDMGFTNDIGIAIIKAHREGIVTSASLMPTTPFFDEAVRMCKENPKLSVGIHLTVMGFRNRPMLSPDQVPSLVNEFGFFYDTRDELEKASPDPIEIEKELRAQIDKVRATGLHFDYLDYHMNPPEIVLDIMKKICLEQKLIYGNDHIGSSYGYTRQHHDIENWPSMTLADGQLVYYDTTPLSPEKEQMFYDLLNNLQPGVRKLVIHPGLVGKERACMTRLLCSEKARDIIKKRNIQLISFADLWEEKYGKSKP
jgi:chitin disaccharide deacetylase